jgi:cholinesterase
VIDPSTEATGLGTQHTIETSAIWGPKYVSHVPPASYSNINAPIVPLMQGYWTSFIRTYDPNTHRANGAPEWRPFTAYGMKRIFIRTNETKMETVPQDQRERCAYLAGIAVSIQQ